MSKRPTELYHALLDEFFTLTTHKSEPVTADLASDEWYEQLEQAEKRYRRKAELQRCIEAYRRGEDIVLAKLSFDPTETEIEWQRKATIATLHHTTKQALQLRHRKEREDVNAAALKKAAGSFDPSVKGKPVGEVRHEHKVKAGFMTAGFVSGPQLDPDQAFGLAFYQVQGLFSLLTSDDPLTSEGTRILPEANFHCFDMYPHSDWGNPTQNRHQFSPRSGVASNN